MPDRNIANLTCGIISAGVFDMRNYLALCATLIALMGLCATSLAQDGHARWHHYYQHWKQPGTTTSCCNARVMQPWGETGDCEPTRYEIRNGQWYAWLRQESRWLPIPQAKIIRERNPSGEEGHLCWTPAAGILCAVPPDLGG